VLSLSFLLCYSIVHCRQCCDDRNRSIARSWSRSFFRDRDRDRDPNRKTRSGSGSKAKNRTAETAKTAVCSLLYCKIIFHVTPKLLQHVVGVCFQWIELINMTLYLKTISTALKPIFQLLISLRYCGYEAYVLCTYNPRFHRQYKSAQYCWKDWKYHSPNYWSFKCSYT
jgi:hypothetical protein